MKKLNEILSEMEITDDLHKKEVFPYEKLDMGSVVRTLKLTSSNLTRIIKVCKALDIYPTLPRDSRSIQVIDQNYLDENPNHIEYVFNPDNEYIFYIKEKNRLYYVHGGKACRLDKLSSHFDMEDVRRWAPLILASYLGYDVRDQFELKERLEKIQPLGKLSESFMESWLMRKENNEIVRISINGKKFIVYFSHPQILSLSEEL